MLVRVRPDPADGRLAVMNLRRPLRLLTKPVANTNTRTPAVGHKPHHLPAPLLLVSRLPCPSVDENQHRQLLSRFAALRQKQIQPLPHIVSAGIRNIQLRLDRRRNGRRLRALGGHRREKC